MVPQGNPISRQTRGADTSRLESARLFYVVIPSRQSAQSEHPRAHGRTDWTASGHPRHRASGRNAPCLSPPRQMSQYASWALYQADAAWDPLRLATLVEFYLVQPPQTPTRPARIEPPCGLGPSAPAATQGLFQFERGERNMAPSSRHLRLQRGGRGLRSDAHPADERAARDRSSFNLRHGDPVACWTVSRRYFYFQADDPGSGALAPRSCYATFPWPNRDRLGGPEASCMCITGPSSTPRRGRHPFPRPFTVPVDRGLHAFHSCGKCNRHLSFR